jgi:PAS domain S-box-containing protein
VACLNAIDLSATEGRNVTGNVNLTQLREEAERVVANSKFGELDGFSSAAETPVTVQLLEELQIHQTELEMQNQQLQQSQTDLALAAEKYRSLFDDLPLPAVLVDANGWILESNRQANVLLGLRLSHLKQHYSLLRYLQGPKQQELVSVLHGNQGSGVVVVTKASLFGDDGHTLPCDLHVLNLHSTAKQAERSVVLVVDRTLELQVLEHAAALQNAKDAAESANRAKSAFLANMSHEIRTPLNAITGMTYLMRRSGVNAEQEDRLNKIEAAGRHLLNIITAVLDLSKIEAGKFTLEQQPISLEHIFENVQAMVGESVRAKGLTLELHCDVKESGFLGDATRIQQALLNYVSNAIKFTQHGTVRLRAIAEHETLQSVKVRFEVQDTGVGIAPDALPRLFNAFEQADNSITRRYGGTGLGLTITRKIAERMGGEAGAESQLGWGSTFWFTAVLLKKSPVHAWHSIQNEERAEASLRQEHQGKRVLLVEDEEINREIAHIVLEEVGMRVDVAVHGKAAVELAQHNRYDAILMDIQMPVMDGLQATRSIRKMDWHKNTPVIAFTANAFTEDRQLCAEAGMNDFIPKPTPPVEIYRALMRVWARRV